MAWLAVTVQSINEKICKLYLYLDTMSHDADVITANIKYNTHTHTFFTSLIKRTDSLTKELWVCVCISITADTHYWVRGQKSLVQSKVCATLYLFCDKAVGKLVYQQMIFLALNPKLATSIEWEEVMLKTYLLCSCTSPRFGT